MAVLGAGARLIIVCGLPGAGKTTLARALEQRLGAVRFSPDEWMEALGASLPDEALRAGVEALQWKLSQQLLALGLTIIIEWGTWARSERDALRLRARGLGAAAELHYVHAPMEVLMERIRLRGREQPVIEMSDLGRWLGIFEPPTSEEMGLYDTPPDLM